jgi:hypothetical protein
MTEYLQGEVFMSNSTPPQAPKESFVANPQILAATITAIATVLVALISVLPNLLPKETPTPTTVVIVVTPTMPVENTPSLTPTLEASATNVVETSQPTDIPPTQTSVPSPIPNNTQPPTIFATLPNVLLMYDEVSFTLLNQTTGVVSLEGVIFSSSVGQWNAVEWGPSLYNSLPSAMCLRLRDATVGQRQPPQPCVNQIYGLIETQGSSLFWIGVEQFDVQKNGALVSTCQVSVGNCPIYIP